MADDQEQRDSHFRHFAARLRDAVGRRRVRRGDGRRLGRGGAVVETDVQVKTPDGMCDAASFIHRPGHTPPC